MGGRLMDGRSPFVLGRGELACHCLLVETRNGLVLVDTGLGLRDCRHPRTRLSAFFLALLRPALREEMTAVRQVARLGYDPRDVRHIVLTHLDFDHAGGLDDFPEATVHLLGAERTAAFSQRTWLDRQRYRPQQWSTRDKWRVYAANQGDTWHGFSCVRELNGVGDDIVMVPLVGHTFGHAGIAVKRRIGGAARWLLQAGDAYFFHQEMDLERPHCTPGLRFYQWMMQKDSHARRSNQERLRELKRRHGDAVAVCCGHDPTEFERFSARVVRDPADRRALANHQGRLGLGT